MSREKWQWLDETALQKTLAGRCEWPHWAPRLVGCELPTSPRWLLLVAIVDGRHWALGWCCPPQIMQGLQSHMRMGRRDTRGDPVELWAFASLHFGCESADEADGSVVV